MRTDNDPFNFRADAHNDTLIRVYECTQTSNLERKMCGSIRSIWWHANSEMKWIFVHHTRQMACDGSLSRMENVNEQHIRMICVSISLVQRYIHSYRHNTNGTHIFMAHKNRYPWTYASQSVSQSCIFNSKQTQVKVESYEKQTMTYLSSLCFRFVHRTQQQNDAFTGILWYAYASLLAAAANCLWCSMAMQTDTNTKA